MINIAVIILTYNSSKFIPTLFESLHNQIFKQFDIYVFDNKSSDNTVEKVKKILPKDNVVVMRKNYLFAKTLNYATRKLKHQFLVFINADLKLDKNWLYFLIKTYEKNQGKNIVLLNSKSLLWDHEKNIDSVGGKLTINGGGMNIGLFDVDSEKYSKNAYIGTAVGSSMFVDREKFLKLGGFDQNLLMNVEETDFCWRSWILGYRIIVVPKSVVYHKISYSWKQVDSVLRNYLNIRNVNLTILNNVENPYMMIFFAINFAYNLFRLFKNPSYNFAKAFYLSYIYIIKNRHQIIEKRRRIQTLKKNSIYHLYSWGLFENLSNSIRRSFMNKNNF